MHVGRGVILELNTNITQLSKRQMLQMCVENTNSILNRRALFSDGTELFRSPSQPDCYEVVRIRIRTALNNVDSVYLICGGTRMSLSRS